MEINLVQILWGIVAGLVLVVGSIAIGVLLAMIKSIKEK